MAWSPRFRVAGRVNHSLLIHQVALLARATTFVLTDDSRCVLQVFDRSLIAIIAFQKSPA
jgi:hypothetical protein